MNYPVNATGTRALPTWQEAWAAWEWPSISPEGAFVMGYAGEAMACHTRAVQAAPDATIREGTELLQIFTYTLGQVESWWQDWQEHALTAPPGSLEARFARSSRAAFMAGFTAARGAHDAAIAAQRTP